MLLARVSRVAHDFQSFKVEVGVRNSYQGADDAGGVDNNSFDGGKASEDFPEGGIVGEGFESEFEDEVIGEDGKRFGDEREGTEIALVQ
ncbi:hypothetical protein QQ045_019108 [Rhodiola kirilowii]